MSDTTQIEKCHHCGEPVRHKRGPIATNALLEGKTEIRLCLGCFFGYRGRYGRQGFKFIELEKYREQ